MSEIPSARVVRGGAGAAATEPAAGAEVASPGRVLRLAPRAVPRPLAWRLLLGHPFGVGGWLFAVCCMAAALAFARCSDVGFAHHDRTATATVTRVERTTMSENEEPIYRVYFTFVDPSGVARSGASYTMDPPAAPVPTFRAEYRSSDPSESQLSGMRRRPFSPLFVIVIIAMALFGLALGLWQIVQGRRDLRLLRHGVETSGKLMAKRPTDTSNEPDDPQPTMALTFEYEVGGRTYSATVKTERPELLEDDAREPMVYDPYVPSRATTLDHLPGSPRLTAGGELEVHLGSALPYLIPPVLCIGLLTAMVIRLL
jgi:hypothetical protein